MRAQRAGMLSSLALLLAAMTTTEAQDFNCLGASAPDSMQSIGPNPIGKVMFVHAPGRPDNYPIWVGDLCQQLSSFLSYESGRRYQMTFSPLYQPGVNVSKTWELPRSAADYGHVCDRLHPEILCYGDANKDIMLAAAAGDPAIWSGVQKVIVIYETGSCVLTSCPSGVGDLGLRGSIPNFTGNGCTLVLATGELDEPTLNFRVLSGVAHEFGHTLGFGDVGVQIVQHCGSPPTTPIGNVGRYDLMRSPGDSLPPDNGVWSYHPRWLVSQSVGVPLFTITSAAGDQMLRIPNIRDPVRGAVYQVGFGAQYFLLANYQPGVFGPWDDVFGGDGLLIWHNWVSPNGFVVDLESAEGKFTNGVPDPVNGKDPLESDWCYRGSGRDFFGREPLPPSPGKPDPDVPPREFSAYTNPNTNFYGTSYLSQPFCGDVEFRNIHRDTNGDMLVDVSWLKQPLLSPNGGQFFVRGQQVQVQWAVTPTRQACVQSVDVRLQLPLVGGVALGQSLPNNGSVTVTIPSNQAFSSNYFLEVDTRLARVDGQPDPAGPIITDFSDTPVTIWGVDEASIVPVVTTFCENGRSYVRLQASWQTSATSDAGQDKLQLYSQSTNILLGTQTGGTGGTSHGLTLQVGCQTSSYYFRVNSKRGISETVSTDHFFQVTSCPSCPPCPPDGCQIE